MRKHNAPGLRRRERKNGAAYYWVATAVSRQATDYPTKTVRLQYETDEERATACRRLTAELREWLTLNGQKVVPTFDGTIGGLIQIYQMDEDSPYHAIRENTRQSYDHDLKTLNRKVGVRRIDQLGRRDFVRWHRAFSAPKNEGEPEKLRRARGLMTMLRILMSFGSAMEFEGCARVRNILSLMRFKMPEKRQQRLTYEYALAVIDEAISQGRLSIALAQALQFETTLRQIDVIGYWESPEGQPSGIVSGRRQWTGGITWGDLTGMVLRKTTTKTGRAGAWDLSECPLVLKVLNLVDDADRVGPFIINEDTGKPYADKRYSREWRKIADKVGVPRDVWNRDSRSGGLTEGADSGADPKDLQTLATHESFKTTENYIRLGVEATSRVAVLRAKHRKGREPG